MSADQNVNWLGVSGLTLILMSWSCKGYTSASEIKNFDSRVKQNSQGRSGLPCEFDADLW